MSSIELSAEDLHRCYRACRLGADILTAELRDVTHPRSRVVFLDEIGAMQKLAEKFRVAFDNAKLS